MRADVTAQKSTNAASIALQRLFAQNKAQRVKIGNLPNKHCDKSVYLIQRPNYIATQAKYRVSPKIQFTLKINPPRNKT